MSSGFYLVSGFMHINMGCEVMFVLANRMKAQNVDMNTVGSKILCDVTLMMFKKSLIQGMLKMQTPITVPNLYEVFNKFVNSSLMRLDKNSMQKLFYLVLMTFKRQLFLLSNPLELYTLTLTHLQDVAQIQKNNAQATACIQEAIAIFKREADKITYLLYLDLKEEMLSMFESYKSKIVLFCDNGSQEQNGCLVFQPRNCHNRKNIGLGQNHPSIDFPNQNQWIGRKNIQLSNYTSWKTNLGKDDYDNVRGSSKILQMKPKSKKNVQEDSKQIGDILGIKNIRLDSYEVKIDIFNESQKQMKESKKSENIKVAQTKIDNDIKKKIQKQFDDLAIGDEKKEGDDEIDLLELMDS